MIYFFILIAKNITPYILYVYESNFNNFMYKRLVVVVVLLYDVGKIIRF